MPSITQAYVAAQAASSPAISAPFVANLLASPTAQNAAVDFPVDAVFFDMSQVATLSGFMDSAVRVASNEILGGSGTLDLNLINTGFVSPGDALGVQNVAGYSQSSTATLKIEIGGDSAGSGTGHYDQLNVSGAAQLGGNLAISLSGGYKPKDGEVFTVMNFGSASGQFANITGLLQANDQVYFEVAQEASKLTLTAHTVAPVGGAGANLVFTPVDPAAPILIGDLASGTVSSQTLQLSTDSLKYLQDGFHEIVVGSQIGNSVISIGGAGSTTPVTLSDTLHLINPMQGGEVFINAPLNLTGDASLVIEGSGHTTTIAAPGASVAADILLYDSVKINGGVTLTAGTGGVGQIQLGSVPSHFVDGNGDTTPDSLHLQATGNIVVAGNVGSFDPLYGLTLDGTTVGGTVNNPDDVTFNGTVILNGDFNITATGTVLFKNTVTLHRGANLNITGASAVIFQGGLVLDGVSAAGAGAILIEGNEINFAGGESSVSGAGTLTLRQSSTGVAMEIGDPPNSNSAALNITNAELLAVQQGFSKLVFGKADASGHAAAGDGAVRIGANNGLSQPTLGNSVEIYGSAITLEDYSASGVVTQVYGTIKLDATNDIILRNRLQAYDGSSWYDVNLYSASGAVKQLDNTTDGLSSEPLQGQNLTVSAATGINLFATEFNNVSAVNRSSGDLVLGETANGGALNVLQALQSSALGSGNISIRTAAGNLTIDASGTGVNNLGTGNLSLNASGTGTELLVKHSISTTVGAISLTANANLTVGDAVLVSGSG
ncbi:MAG: hypothetical protein NTZ64_15030, partial [Polaromonas sp.]|nr:hypothetical protein [Polaromonas sp.]